MSFEFLIWILAVVAAFVFHLRKSARNKPRPSARVATPEDLRPEPAAAASPADMAAAPDPEVIDEEMYAPPEPITVEWGRHEQPPQPAAAAVPRAAPAPHVTDWRRGDRLELQHAVVAMTVLGPCRALAPYGQDEGSPSAGARTRPAPPAASRRP